MGQPTKVEATLVGPSFAGHRFEDPNFVEPGSAVVVVVVAVVAVVAIVAVVVGPH